MTRDTKEYYLAFISIVFGIFIGVWAKPIIDTIDDFRRPSSHAEAVSSTNSTLTVNANAIHQSAVDTDGATKRIRDVIARVGILGIVQGLLTLVIIVCLWWWYGVFLRTFAPAEGFLMYLYDFGSLGVFAVAAGIWMDIKGCFASTVLVSMICICFRFGGARKKTKRSKRAHKALTIAMWVVIVLIGMGVVFNLGFFAGTDGHGLISERTLRNYLIFAMMFSVGVTAFAVNTTEGLRWGRPFILGPDFSINHLIDPTLSPLPDTKPSECAAIENQCQRALWEFGEKCEEYGLNKIDGVVSSEVHSAHDLHCQAKLAIYAAAGGDEIRKRVQMMYFVHWFDDVMDQREKVTQRLTEQKKLEYETIFSLSRSLSRHKDLADYYRQWFGSSKSFFDMGLIRLIYGGRLFKATRENEIISLREKHIAVLEKEGVSKDLLKYDIRYIDLTVKTVMEFWFGMEETRVSVDYAFLFSLLYGPGLYYHDFREETKAGELNAKWGELDEGDTVEMIRDVGNKIEKLLCSDPKAEGRAQEVAHFVLCFGNVFPTEVKLAYDKVATQLLNTTRGIALDF